VHIDVDEGIGAETEMQPRIVAGIKTALAKDALSLSFTAIMHENASTDGGAIGLSAFEFDLNPVRLATNIVAQ